MRFEAQVHRFADRVAVREPLRDWSYGELNRLANRIAHTLIERRSSVEEPVVMFFDLSALSVATILGILKAGKFYVPLEPRDPPSRLRSILQDIKPGMVIAQDTHFELVEKLCTGAHPVFRMNLDQLSSNIENPNILFGADRLAYVLYTSGSTGTPKGVMQNHRNVLFDIWRQAHDLGVGPSDCYGLLFSICFSASVCHIFGSLLSGASVSLFDVRRQGLNRMAAWLNDHAVTICDMNVATFRAFTATLKGGERFPHMRVIAPGSEPLYRSDVELYKHTFDPPCVLQNALGTTETRTVTQYLLTHEDALDETAAVPVGWAVTDKEVLILGADGRPVESGQVGEIAVRSRYLSPGYWARPDLTARSFRHAPGDADARIYLTGDLGRQRADGCFVHVGRRDFQVKIRGYRVETSEVETTLLRLPEVLDAAVVVEETTPGERRLAAYLVANSGARLEASRLRSTLAETLPGYMAPSVYYVLESMPLTATGKLDRRALSPTLAIRNLSRSRAAETALTDTQGVLKTLWDRLFQADVSVKDDFFDLGGNSLQALHLFASIEREFDKVLPLSALLDAPTIDQLSAVIDAGGGGATTPHGLAVTLRASGTGLPVFFLPGNGGHAFSYRKITDLMTPDRPCYGLEYPGLKGEQQPLDSIEAIAGAFLEEIRRIQPQGPYRLVGYSFGGLVGYEIAHRLTKIDERVASLILLDAWVPNASVTQPLRTRVKAHARYFLSADIEGKRQYLEQRWKNLKRRVQSIELDEMDLGLPTDDGWHSAAIEAVREACRRARRTYEPSTYTGNMQLIRCTKRDFKKRYSVTDEFNGWKHLVSGEVDVRTIDCMHLEMFEPRYAIRMTTFIQDWLS